MLPSARTVNLACFFAFNSAIFLEEGYSDFDQISSVKICYVISSDFNYADGKMRSPAEKDAGTARQTFQVSSLSYSM